jgi:hypothetical protein
LEQVLVSIFPRKYSTNLSFCCAASERAYPIWSDGPRPGGRFIAMGPNIKYTQGAYWDFFDHYVELTELSLSEALSICGFGFEKKVGRFLPYTMSHGQQYPLWMLRLYLALPAMWPIFRKQFLVIGRKPLRDTDFPPKIPNTRC